MAQEIVMKAQLMQFWQDEEGATAIEYGLIAGLIAVVLITALTALGGGLGTLFTNIRNCLPGSGETCELIPAGT
jgi:pilus assembly protein Flp/PilA